MVDCRMAPHLPHPPAWYQSKDIAADSHDVLARAVAGTSGGGGAAAPYAARQTAGNECGSGVIRMRDSAGNEQRFRRLDGHAVCGLRLRQYLSAGGGKDRLGISRLP